MHCSLVLSYTVLMNRAAVAFCTGCWWPPAALALAVIWTGEASLPAALHRRVPRNKEPNSNENEDVGRPVLFRPFAWVVVPGSGRLLKIELLWALSHDVQSQVAMMYKDSVSDCCCVGSDQLEFMLLPVLFWGGLITEFFDLVQSDSGHVQHSVPKTLLGYCHNHLGHAQNSCIHSGAQVTHPW